MKNRPILNFSNRICITEANTAKNTRHNSPIGSANQTPRMNEGAVFKVNQAALSNMRKSYESSGVNPFSSATVSSQNSPHKGCV
jgi:hypothetical protein